jgi:sulfite exporter TauE/SafE
MVKKRLHVTFSDQLFLLASRCQVAIDHSGPLILGLFMAGLVGSVSHCAGMCGPFVLAQVAARQAIAAPAQSDMPQMRRLAGLALLPYHFGRATTYALIAMVLAAPVALLARLPDLRWLPSVLLAAAALLFLLQALKSWGLVPGILRGWGASDAGANPRLLTPVRTLFQRPVGWRGYVLGVVLGFLPCGLLYAALAAAAATADPLAAGMAMLGFVLGTMPMLLGIGLLGHGLVAHWRALAARALPLIATANALVLLVMAWRLSGLA